MKCGDCMYIYTYTYKYIYTHLYICAADKRHQRGNNWRGSESSEQDFGIIIDHKLHASQEYFALERKQISKWDV